VAFERGDALRRRAARRGGRSGKLTELVRAYLDSDFDDIERTCNQCRSPERDHDAEGYCSVCKLRPLEQKFPAEFRAWVTNLTRLYLWRKAGYPLAADELSFEEWGALAIITRWYEVKDTEAMLRAAQPAQ
jgi:hypothetical protein